MRQFYPGLIFLILLLAAGCNSKFHYRIDGKFAEGQYDGEQIYLVPMVGATPDNVDSCTILGGAFHFEGKADSAQIYILRTRIALRVKIQETIVAKEEGKAWVALGDRSFVGGTPTNDSIQAWKVQKEKLDEEIYNLQIAKRQLTGPEGERATERLDSLITATRAFHLATAKRNEENTFGELLKNMLGEKAVAQDGF
ncbi:uncharacterized protein DUF4369 [Mangrovibacterium diazotrophicum]|uniref:Uncharacterized protein DUF4369 n=2 Tax=Mangrovibacterium diazotrophicum TaxID=1261403 RepID=A0A419W5D2_9BACT|nr:uncharacterized protein DUF4369 [Mangrovibacterium diazotrophicum]